MEEKLSTIKIVFKCGTAGTVTWELPRGSIGNIALSDDELRKLVEASWGTPVKGLFKLFQVSILGENAKLRRHLPELLTSFEAQARRLLGRL